MTTTVSTRSKIVTYAERMKSEEGQTYRESAKKLGISESSLYRYRRKTTRPSGRTSRQMRRGGKLTQLLQSIGDEGEQFPPGSFVDTDELLDRPKVASGFSSRLGAGEVLKIDGPAQVKVTARRFVMAEGTESETYVWRVGPPEGTLGRLVEERSRIFALAEGEDEQSLGGRVSQWFAEEGIIESPGAKEMSGAPEIRKVEL